MGSDEVGLVGRLRMDHPRVSSQTWKRLKSKETMRTWWPRRPPGSSCSSSRRSCHRPSLTSTWSRRRWAARPEALVTVTDSNPRSSCGQRGTALGSEPHTGLGPGVSGGGVWGFRGHKEQRSAQEEQAIFGMEGPVPGHSMLLRVTLRGRGHGLAQVAGERSAGTLHLQRI